MMLTEYETTVVIRPDLGGDAIETMLDRVREVVRDGGGKLIAIDHWGKRKLAYPMKKQSRGIYVHTHYLGGSKLVAELERNLRINDTVLRYLTIRMAQGVDPAERVEKEYVVPQYDANDAMPHEEESFESRDRYDRDYDRGDDVDRHRGDDTDKHHGDHEAHGAGDEE
ncbi:MAG: 30S ribosomal protein S6 [Myxococcota bacterium]|mgnify:CR=1 FL=1